MQQHKDGRYAKDQKDKKFLLTQQLGSTTQNKNIPKRTAPFRIVPYRIDLKSKNMKEKKDFYFSGTSGEDGTRYRYGI
jgi:hypothetical protein